MEAPPPATRHRHHPGFPLKGPAGALDIEPGPAGATKPAPPQPIPSPDGGATPTTRQETAVTNEIAPIALQAAPAVTWYQGATYRSDREYVDATGATWTYAGLHDGGAYWGSDSVPGALWPLPTVIDERGPLMVAQAAS